MNNLLIFLSLSSTLLKFVTGTSKKFHVGINTFPRHTPFGKEAANEFQMLLPHNVQNELSFASNYSISLVYPTVINNDEVVTVEYVSSKPASGDWIGAYSPPDVNITTTVPIKYGYCNEVTSYMQDGTGYLTFNLTNLRSDVVFYYFKGGTKKPTTVDKSYVTVTFNNTNQPLRPRMLPTGDPDIFQLLWSSATSELPLLKWGTKSESYDNFVNATTSQIDQNQMCGAPASTIGWRDLGLIHNAKLNGMIKLANSVIYYKFGDSSTNDFSAEHHFQVPPLAGKQPLNRPTTVVLFDDLGRGSNDMTYTWNEYGRPAFNTTASVGALVQAGKVDAVFLGGDISYATGYEAVWDFFLDMISPVASGALFMTIVGNHESDWPGTSTLYPANTDSGGECGVSTLTLLPEPAPATLNQPWWSYDIGLIHFIGVSTEHDYAVGSTQYLWLEQDLKSVDRTVTPWIIFGAHRAMYLNSNYGGKDSSDIVVMDNMIEHLEPLLWKYRVNLGFYGHNHAVQRHSAVLNRTVVQASSSRVDSSGNTVHWHSDPQATVHMVIGTGGASFTKNFVTPYPDWNELVFYRWGYAVVQAVDSSYLSWEWIDSSNDQVIDRMVITQSDPTKPWNLSSDSSSSSNNKTNIIIGVVVAGVVLILLIYSYFHFFRTKESLLHDGTSHPQV